MTARWFPDSMPPPVADNEALPWWQAAAEHRLCVQHCTDCSHSTLPPAPICPQCRSSAFEWLEVSGKGTVYTYTIVHRAVAVEQELPFVIAVIELDGTGGLRMMSNLVDIDPAEVTVGLRVEVIWEDMAPGLAIPRFRVEVQGAMRGRQ